MSNNASPSVALGTTALPAINKNLAITNSSSVDIAMLDGYGTDDSQVVYEQGLTQWTTTAGTKSIKAGGTGTIVLDDTHNDESGTPTYSKAYSIIYVKPDNFFPVKLKGSLLVHSTQAYAPVTVTNDDVTVMTQTQEFLQTIMAYPTSTLAKNYAAALQSTTSSASSDTDVDTGVAAFFASTNQFKEVTLDSITAVSTYYSQFPYVWADYLATKSFYFYSSDGTTTTYNGSITLNIPSTPTTDKSLPGFTFTYTDANNNSKPLYFANGQFVDNLNSDVPAICLSGLFTLKSTLTKVSTDNTIIPILIGTVNGDQVIGYEDKMTKNSDDDGWSGCYALLHPQNAQGWITLFMTFVGLVMGIDFVMKGLKGVKDGFVELKDNIADKLGLDNPNDAPITPDDVTSVKTAAATESAATKTKMQELADKLDAQVKINENLNDQITDLQGQLQNRLNEDRRTAMDDEAQNLENELQAELDAGVNNQKLVDTDGMLDDDWTAIDNAGATELESVLDAQKGPFADLKVTIDGSYNAALSKTSGDAKAELQADKTQADTATTESDTIDNQGGDAKDGGTGGDDYEFALDD